MGKSRAEIQREYRARKKAKEGELYHQKERERVKRYYVPIDERSSKEKKSRREYVKKHVKQHRLRKSLTEQSVDTIELNEHNRETSNVNTETVVSSSTDVCSSSTTRPHLVVKLPNLDPKQRTRKRISRATARNRRELEKLKQENESMRRRYKTVSKRYERLNLKMKISKNLDEKKQAVTDSCDSLPVENVPTHLTPRKRTLSQLREEGVTPTKLPKVVIEKLVMANVVADEIETAWQSNGQRGKKVISRIVSGKIIAKYRLKHKLGKLTRIKRKHLNSHSKKIENIPRIKKRVVYKNKQREDVVAFLERDDNSRMMPGKADKVKTESGNMQKRVLNDNMANLHMKFKSETSHNLSLSTFCRLRPKYFRLTKYITRNKCLCQKHQNMALLLKSTKASGGEVPLNPDEFAKKLRDTNPQNLITKLQAGNIKYNQWAKVDCPDGKKRTKIVEKELIHEEFCSMFLQMSAEFKEHIENSHQQYKAMKDLKDMLPKGHIIVQMDFAENYACSSADEVQSAYWNCNSVTLHPTVVYYKTPENTLDHKSYMFVSDDNGHNIGAVYTIMKKLVPDVKAELVNVDKVHYWTDSPSSQYRNKTAFYLTSAHEELLTVPATWDYFEAGHGKGPCDGLGGAAKRMADLAVKQGKMSIQDASDFYKWGKEYQTSVKYLYISKEECEKSREEITEINKTIFPVKGTLQIHSIVPIRQGKLRTNVTSCYCEQCLQGFFHQGTIADILQKEKTSQVQKKSVVEHKLELPMITTSDAGKLGEIDDGKANDIDGGKFDEINDSKTDEITQNNDIEDNESEHVQFSKLKNNDWISVRLEDDWYIGKIIEIDTESDDCKVTFMRKSSSSNTKQTNFKWPMPADELWVKSKDIVLQIDAPIPFGRSGRSFDISEADLQKILNAV